VETIILRVSVTVATRSKNLGPRTGIVCSSLILGLNICILIPVSDIKERTRADEH
jgi:hypothetical protein